MSREKIPSSTKLSLLCDSFVRLQSHESISNIAASPESLKVARRQTKIEHGKPLIAFGLSGSAGPGLWGDT